MQLKFLALSLLMVAGVNMVNAQNSTHDFVSEDRKHDIRLSVRDGLTQGTSNILGMGISDAVLGTKRSDTKTSLTYGFGYRYSINRFRLGADLGFGMTTSKLALAGVKKLINNKRHQPGSKIRFHSIDKKMSHSYKDSIQPKNRCGKQCP